MIDVAGNIRKMMSSLDELQGSVNSFDQRIRNLERNDTSRCNTEVSS